MKAIVKGQEPPSLLQHRASSHADYENYQQKDDIRAALCAEQGYICCYCLQRIRPTADGMKIEHCHCQKNYPSEQLDFGNLLGACLGGQGKPPNLQHCDTRKGDLELSRNPANSAHKIESIISFLTDGTIESSDNTLNDELNDVLNLNLPILRRNRKAVLDQFKQSLAGRGTLTKKRELGAWDIIGSGGSLNAYCQVVVYWLRKRMKRAKT